MRSIGLTLVLVIAAQAAMAMDASAAFSLAELHRKAGRASAALEVLGRLDESLPPLADERTRIAESYATLGKPSDALRVLEGLNASGAAASEARSMSIARLRESAGQKGPALAAWRSLWDARLSESQRTVVEDRIVELAAEQNLLETLARELKEKHADAQASRADTALLARLYVRASNKEAAARVIDENLDADGSDAVERLKERVRLYRLVGESARVRRDLQRLVQIDPGNASTYVRESVLDWLGAPHGERLSGLRASLAQLREVESAESSRRFTAGVLRQAGFPEEAAVLYRAEYVLHPEDCEMFLLLGEALGRLQRGDEALALGQGLAMEAPSPESFITAIDGVLNALGAGAYGKSRRALDWSQRLILERIVSRGDSLQLYGLMAEVAEAARDPLQQFAVTETSLPLAGELRSSSLRQLIELATPARDDLTGPQRAAIPEADELRNRMGIRLLALSEALPPQLYLDIGADLLHRGDVAAATRAFEQAVDIGGRLNLLSETGARYEQAGFTERALESYQRAFAADTDDVEVRLRLAGLLEREDVRARAHSLYARGLRAILARQGDGPAATFEVRRYAEALSSGALRTWPLHGQPESDVQRDVADVANLRLQSKPARTDVGGTSVERLNLARLNDDQEQMLAAAFERAESGDYAQALDWAGGRVERSRYRELCRRIEGLLRKNEAAFLPYLAEHAPFADELERCTGRAPFSSTELLRQMAVVPAPGQPLRDVLLYIDTIPYLAKHLAPDDALALMRRLTQGPDRVSWLWVVTSLWCELARSPWTDQFGSELTELMLALLDNHPMVVERPYTVLGALLDAKLHPHNVDAVRAFSARWNALSGIGADYFKPLLDWRSGDTRAAVDGFVQLADLLASLRDEGAPFQAQSQLLAFRKVQAALLAELNAEITTAATARGASWSERRRVELAFRIFHSDRERYDAEAFAFLQRAVQLAPDNEEILRHFYNACRDRGYTPEAIGVLETLLRLDPDNLRYRGHLYGAYLAADRPIEAMRLNQESQEDLRAPGVLSALESRPEALQSLGPTMRPVFLVTRDPARYRPGGEAAERIRDAAESHDVANARRELRGLWQRTSDIPLATDGPWSRLTPAGVLGLAVPLSGAQAPMPQIERVDDMSIQQALRRSDRPYRRLFDILPEYAFSIGEMEDYLRAVPPDEEAMIYPLLQSLAAAYQKHGRGAGMFTALASRIEAGSATRHEISLWLNLAVLRTPPGVDRADLRLATRLAEEGKLSLQQQLEAARMLGSGAQHSDALQIYRRIAIATLDATGPSHELLYFDSSTADIPSALLLLQTASRYLDERHRLELVTDLVRLHDPGPQAAADFRVDHASFRLRAFEAANLQPETLRPALQALVTAAPATTGDLLVVANLQARAGRRDRAIDAITRSLSRREESSMQEESLLQRARFVRGADSSLLFELQRHARRFLDDRTLDGNAVRQLCSLAAHELHERAEPIRARALLQQIFDSPASNTDNAADLELTMSVADRIGMPIPLVLAQRQLREGRLRLHRIVPAILQTAQTEGAPAAIVLAELAVARTQRDDLLETLIRLNEQAGKAADAARWRSARAAAARARAALGR